LNVSYKEVLYLSGNNSYRIDRLIAVAYAEDHATTREVLKGFLVKYGFRVQIEASDGRALLDELQEAPALPDVCLLDLSMPVMNGFETMKELHEKYPGIKVLAYSTNDQTELVEAILACGAHGFISKAVDPVEIKEGLLAVYHGRPFIRQQENSIAQSGNRKAMYPLNHITQTPVLSDDEITAGHVHDGKPHA
jgi:DNA-binding NarL/FixJ family response regulator